MKGSAMNEHELNVEAEQLARQVWPNDGCWREPWDIWPQYYRNKKPLKLEKQKTLQTLIDALVSKRQIKIDIAKKYLIIIKRMGYRR